MTVALFDPVQLDVKQAHVVSQWAHDRPLIACRFDPLRRYVFCGSEDKLLTRFALADGAKTVFAGGHETWVKTIAFSSDGQFVISGGYDGKLTWWETAAETPTPVRSFAAHGTNWIRSLEVSPDGTRLASGGNDNIARLWNIADGSLIREFKGHEKHIYSVTFGLDGKSLFSGDLGGSIRQWDIESGAETRTLDAKELWSYNGGQQVDFGGVRALAVSPDGKFLAAGGLYKASNPLGAVHEPLVLLFNLESGAIDRKMIAEGITQGVVWRLRWLSDGSLMAVDGGANGGWLLFWKTDAEKDYHRFQLPNIARDMDLHPDGIQVCSAHHDRHVRITRLAAKA
ncbi:MAG: WD40 repeat domain-containing protein [Planctomycetaceae bacterium]|nr:WD40 repeat domain-containing protein [Planctomycetaceae bacterium]